MKSTATDNEEKCWKEEMKSSESQLNEQKGAKNEEEEIVSFNILPQLFDYINGEKFTSCVQRFISQNCHHFQDVHQTAEFFHDHTAIFDSYQDLVESLLEDFANDQHYSIKSIYKCCKDVADATYAPLFQEDDHLFMVETILSFLEFSSFVDLMTAQSKSHETATRSTEGKSRK